MSLTVTSIPRQGVCPHIQLHLAFGIRHQALCPLPCPSLLFLLQDDVLAAISPLIVGGTHVVALSFCGECIFSIETHCKSPRLF